MFRHKTELTHNDFFYPTILILTILAKHDNKFSDDGLLNRNM